MLLEDQDEHYVDMMLLNYHHDSVIKVQKIVSQIYMQLLKIAQKN